MILPCDLRIAGVHAGAAPGRNDALALADELAGLFSAHPRLETAPGRARPEKGAPNPRRSLIHSDIVIHRGAQERSQVENSANRNRCRNELGWVAEQFPFCRKHGRGQMASSRMAENENAPSELVS